MEEILIGKIVNTYGLKGELKLILNPDYLDIEFKKNAKVKIANNDYVLLNYKRNKHTVIFLLKDHQDINLVEHLKGELLKTTLIEFKTLVKNEYYGFQILSLNVYDQNKQLLGKVERVENTGFQKLLRIKTENNKDILIPWVDFFVRKIDLKEAIVEVETIEGLL